MTAGTLRRLLAERYPAPWRRRHLGAELWLGPTHVYRVEVMRSAQGHFRFVVVDVRDAAWRGGAAMHDLERMPRLLSGSIVSAIFGRGENGAGERAEPTFKRMPPWLRVEMERYAAQQARLSPGCSLFTLPKITT